MNTRKKAFGELGNMMRERAKMCDNLNRIYMGYRDNTIAMVEAADDRQQAIDKCLDWINANFIF